MNSTTSNPRPFAIAKIDHVGIRVRDSKRALAFYALLGFEPAGQSASEAGFLKGHPIIVEHPSGVVLNLLGPASGPDENVLMDMPEKRAGITHIALRVDSIDAAEAHLKANGVAASGRFAYGDLRAFFVRDPDRNVIEFDEYPGESPTARMEPAGAH